MDEKRDLLIEIGTEELPPTALRTLMDAFHQHVVSGLEDAGLVMGEHRGLGTPRRLAVVVRGLPLRQPDRTFERRGPALSAAFDDSGSPTRAAVGFARSCSVAVEALETLTTDKGEWLVHRGVQQGETVEALLPGIIDQALARLPIPRRMRWGDGDVAFVRPVHWVVVMLGDSVVPATVLGIPSGGQTRGHRFHAPDPISINNPSAYEELLEKQCFVIADFERRRELVRNLAEAEAARLGGTAMLNDALLDEVTALVEWPVAITGEFDKQFLEVPPEALVSSMQSHQKYFPVRDARGALMPRFITMANVESRDPTEVARGNERVIRPRLADADFFWNQDRRKPLSERINDLKGIVFQQRLGSLFDKSVRVAALARSLAERFGVSTQAAEQAAMLAKCDLLTQMVGEFPELQGIMGRYYAAHDGLREGIPESLDEQYRPRFAGDVIAESALGRVLAIAERADTLVGIFAIGEGPTGDKDPFALRRSALGLVRTLVESGSSLPLLRLFRTAAEHLPEDVERESSVGEVFAFCMERMRGYYQDKGFDAELFDAVRSVRVRDDHGIRHPVDDPVDFDRRLRALDRFRGQEAALALAAANKRVGNILRKEAKHLNHSEVNSQLFDSIEEKRLHAALEELRVSVLGHAREGRYDEALARLAELREPVDAFFDKVLVMAEDERIRDNRLSLLAQLSALLSSVADISRISKAQ